MLKNCCSLQGRRLKELSKIIQVRCASDSSSGKKDSLEGKKDPLQIDVIHEKTEQVMIPVDKYEDLKMLSPISEEYYKESSAIISKKPKNAMQSGTANTHNYELTFDTKERWENPLMGWSSSGDPQSNLSLDFANPSEAIRYAENNGWNWQHEPVNESKPLKPKSYADNFHWKARTRVSTK